MSEDTRVEVLPVPEGSIIWLHNIAHTLNEDSLTSDLRTALIAASGHDRFVVLVTVGPGVVEVLGPDEMVERVRAALLGRNQ